MVSQNNLQLDNINYWIFDLDNTLYPASSNLFLKIDKRMKKFIVQKLNTTEENAFRIQKKYYLKYGTTLFGLTKNHNIDPEEFLKYVHDIDASSLKKNPQLNKELKKLPGKLYIYTNGSKNHTINVLKNLSINSSMFEIFDITDANYIPKPSKKSLNYFIKRFNINPLKSIFFEDISINLKNPKLLGFKTVLIKNEFHPDNENLIIKNSTNNSKYIDFMTFNITQFIKQINLDMNE